MKKILAILLLLLAGAILFAGCSQYSAPPATPAPTTAATIAATTVATTAPPTTTAPTPAPDSIKVATNATYGMILTDMNGMTLYYFLKDTPANGASACYSACSSLWPPFNTASIRVSAPLQASDFASISRTDGTDQVTYQGWPLYYYSKDLKPGDANGYGFANLWYVMAPTGVVTLAPTTTVPTTVPTTYYMGGGGGGY